MENKYIFWEKVSIRVKTSLFVRIVYMLPPVLWIIHPLMKLLFVLNLIIDRSANETYSSKVSVLKIYTLFFTRPSRADGESRFLTAFLEDINFRFKIIGQ